MTRARFPLRPLTAEKPPVPSGPPAPWLSFQTGRVSWGTCVPLVQHGAAAISPTRQPSARYNYGSRQTSALVALGNAMTLLVITGGFAWEPIGRLFTPEPARGMTIVVVAAACIIVDATTAFVFMSGRMADPNIRGSFLHLAADPLVGLGVVAAGIFVLLTGWLGLILSSASSLRLSSWSGRGRCCGRPSTYPMTLHLKASSGNGNLSAPPERE